MPIPGDQPGGYGLEATKKQPPPTRGATITAPGSGASFSNSPITVSGLCPDGLLVQIYNNNVMAGSTMCNKGSFSLKISLFPGKNDLSAIVYDDLGQAGPTSKITTVTYTDTNLSSFGEQVTLTSTYGRRSAAAEARLVWPLQLSGGTGPYALSIDWGDGSDPQLVSQALAGVFNISHVYKRAGIYQVNVRVTDANGVTAFLQLIAVSNGEATEPPAEKEAAAATPKPVVLWVPTIALLLLLLPTYWLGRRSQLISLKTKMEKERDNYQKR
jgi:hypothetical protein